MPMTVPLLFLSLVMVTAGAEALVRGASALALRWGLSPLFVGLTIVGFGTSSPELAASLVATMRGAGGVSVGNVIGSNIFNVAVILGIATLIRPITIQLAAVRRDLMVAVAAALVPWVSVLFGGVLPRVVGLALVATLVVYLGTAYRLARRATEGDRQLVKVQLEESLLPALTSRRRLDGVGLNLAFVAAGLALLVVGARVFVTSAIDLARALAWSERVIGLTVVAAGTSLPELVTSVVAGLRRNPDMAVGNIIGSNIFNVFGILGACALVRPQTMAPGTLAVDVPVMLLATLALLPIMKTGGRISRGEGALLLGGYGVYLGYLLLR